MNSFTTQLHRSPLAVADPQRDLIDPAVQGTRNVLTEANNVDSVKRVVVTSSIVAIYGDNTDRVDSATGKFTEKDWNSTSSLNHSPYAYSKLLAEKEAWKIAEEQQRWDLITINPSLVIGPGINPHATSESFNLMKNFGNGKMRMGVPGFRRRNRRCTRRGRRTRASGIYTKRVRAISDFRSQHQLPPNGSTVAEGIWASVSLSAVRFSPSPWSGSLALCWISP